MIPLALILKVLCILVGMSYTLASILLLGVTVCGKQFNQCLGSSQSALLVKETLLRPITG